MARKTNKTSHVLHQIMGANAEEGKGTPQAAAPAGRPPAAVPLPQVEVVDSGEDARIAGEIREQLLREVEKEEAQAQTEKPAQDKAAPKTADAAETALQEQAEAAENAAQDGAAQQSADAAGTPAQTEPHHSYRMVNVMEELLDKETVRKEMEKYGVCQCSRCQADVRALLLTRLPAKYVVADETAVVPLLSYYRQRFRVPILTQTIKACQDVRRAPRHQTDSSL